MLVLFLAETVGLWFVSNKLVIPMERRSAAILVYHFSVVSFLFTLLSTPYTAMIIAHEAMNIYAGVSIVEVALKLATAFLLRFILFDKLGLYGILTCCVIGINTYLYWIICRRRFHECKFKFYWNKELYRKFAGYIWWSMFGVLSGIIRNQGIMIFFNQMFNPTIVASRSIALQVNSAVNVFGANISTAAYPQIIKNYSTGQREEMFSLMSRSSKYIFFLTCTIAFPFIFEMNFVLHLWLVSVPAKAVLFSKLMLIETIIDSINYTLGAGIAATGKIRLYQMVVGGLLICNLPVSYIVVILFGEASYVFVVSIIIGFAAYIMRLIFLRFQLGFPLKKYFLETVPRMVGMAFPPVLLGTQIVSYFSESFLRLIIVFVTVFVSSAASIFLIGLEKHERTRIVMIMRNRLTSFCINK
jgi:O-antigen/teichoic acid export membrane protein